MPELNDWVAPQQSAGVNDWLPHPTVNPKVDTVKNPFRDTPSPAPAPVDDWVKPAAAQPAPQAADDWVAPGQPVQQSMPNGVMSGVIDARMAPGPERDKRMAEQQAYESRRIEHILMEPQTMQDIVDYYDGVEGVQFKTNKEALERYVSDRRWVDSNSVSAAKELARVKGVGYEQLTPDQLQILGRLRQRWNEVPAGAEGMESIITNVWRGALDPTALVSLGAGKVLGKGAGMVAGVATDAAIAGAMDQASQQTDKELGLRDSTDWRQTGINALIGGGASAAGHALFSGRIKTSPTEGLENIATQVKREVGDGLGEALPPNAPNAPLAQLGKQAPQDLDPNAPPLLPRDGSDVVPQAAPTEANMAPLDKVGSVNFQRMNIEDEVKNIITEAHETAPTLMDASRRGVRSHETTVKAANNLGFTDADLIQRSDGSYFVRTSEGNRALDAENLYRANSMLIDSAARVKRLAQAAQGGSDQDKLLFRAALDKHYQIQSFAEGAFTEAGRALNILRRISTGQEAADARTLKAVLDSYGGNQNIDRLAELVGNVESVGEMSRLARQVAAPTFGGKVKELWYNFLLSGPTTHMVNFASNSVTQILGVAEKGVAAGIGQTRKLLGIGSKDAYSAGEVLARARAYGNLQGYADALSAGARAWKAGDSQFGNIASSALDQPLKAQISGVKGEIIRSMGTKPLAAADDFFKTLAYRSELHGLAYAEAAKTFKPGTNEFATEVARLVSQPTKDLDHAATQAALKATYQNEPGKFAKGVQMAADNIWGGRIILPFIKTPANLIKYAFERTPFALGFSDVRQAIKAGGREGDEALAKITMGTSAMAAAWGLAQAGVVTGSMPTDPTEKANWQTKKIQPYSIKIGGKWYSYSRFDPLATVFGIGADVDKLSKILEGKGNYDDVLSTLISVVGENLVNKTWLQGVSNAVEAVRDSDRYGANFVNRLAATMVPSVVAQASRAYDPTIYDAKTLVEALLDRTPYRSGLVPRVDLLGRIQRYDEPAPVIPGGGEFINRMLSPIYGKTEDTDPVAQKLWDLKLPIAMPQRTMDGVDLTPDQYYELSAFRGRLARNYLEPVVTNPRFDQLPPAARADMIGKAFTQAGTMAKQYVLMMNPDLRQKIGQEKVAAFFQYEVREARTPLAQQINELFGNQ